MMPSVSHARRALSQCALSQPPRQAEAGEQLDAEVAERRAADGDSPPESVTGFQLRRGRGPMPSFTDVVSASSAPGLRVSRTSPVPGGGSFGGSGSASNAGASAASPPSGASVSSRQSSPPPVAARRCSSSTTAASARVVVSPRLRPSATSRSRRRMILPDRVFGRSGVMKIAFGLAIAPISWATWSRSSSTVSSSGAAAQDHVGEDRLPGRGVVGADHRRLGDGRVGHERRLHLGGRDAVARHVHDVVDAAEEPEVAVVVELGAVAGEVAALEPRPVGVDVALGSPQMPRSMPGHGRVEREVAAADVDAVAPRRRRPRR